MYPFMIKIRDRNGSGEFQCSAKRNIGMGKSPVPVSSDLWPGMNLPEDAFRKSRVEIPAPQKVHRVRKVPQTAVLCDG